MPGCIGSRVPPLIFPIFGGLRPGMLIHISGRPLESPQKFSVSLQHGRSPIPSPEIALFIDTNFTNSTVIRNSRFEGVWGAEENYISEFPFEYDANFSIVITVQPDRFHIVMNRQHTVTFAHRVFDVTRIDTLYIEDDAVISSVRIVGS